MDGLKLYLQQSGNFVIQERFYNWWIHNHYVTSVFCSCPNGTIPIAFFYVLGSVHDSQVTDLGGIYDKLEKVFETTGGKCCVNLGCAFPFSVPFFPDPPKREFLEEFPFLQES